MKKDKKINPVIVILVIVATLIIVDSRIKLSQSNSNLKDSLNEQLKLSKRLEAEYEYQLMRRDWERTSDCWDRGFDSYNYDGTHYCCNNINDSKICLDYWNVVQENPIQINPYNFLSDNENVTVLLSAERYGDLLDRLDITIIGLEGNKCKTSDYDENWITTIRCY